MKIRKIIIVAIFSIFVFSSQKSYIQAEEEIKEETIQETSFQIKKSSVSYDESSLQENVESYLQSKYGTQDWYREEYNTTEKVLNVKPIEMQGENHYEESVIKS